MKHVNQPKVAAQPVATDEVRTVSVEVEDETQTLTPEEWRQIEDTLRDLGIHQDESDADGGISDEAWRFVAKQHCLPLQAVNWAFRQPDLTGSTMLLFAAYAGNMRICGSTKATDEEMAELLGWTRRTVLTHRHNLLDLGYLEPGDGPSTWRPRLPENAGFELKQDPIGIPEDYRDDEIRRRLQQVRKSERGKSRGGVTGACMWLYSLTWKNGGLKPGMCVGLTRLSRALGIDKSRASHTRRALVEEGWLEEHAGWYIPEVPAQEDLYKDPDSETDVKGAQRVVKGAQSDCERSATVVQSLGTEAKYRSPSEKTKVLSSVEVPAESTGTPKSPEQPETTSPEIEQPSRSPGGEEGGVRGGPEVERVPLPTSPDVSRQDVPLAHRDPEWLGGQTDSYREQFAEAVERRVVT